MRKTSWCASQYFFWCLIINPDEILMLPFSTSILLDHCFREDRCLRNVQNMSLVDGKDLEFYSKLLQWITYSMYTCNHISYICHSGLWGLSQYNLHAQLIRIVILPSWMLVFCCTVKIASSYHRFLQTCPDCLLMHTYDKVANHQLFYLFGKYEQWWSIY